QALANFGFAATASLECELRLRNAEVMFGEGLDFEIRVTNAGERAQSLVIGRMAWRRSIVWLCPGARIIALNLKTLGE
ncbi:hypothetical protein ACC691_41385, partial [Rhizobium johnstonii]